MWHLDELNDYKRNNYPEIHRQKTEFPGFINFNAISPFSSFSALDSVDNERKYSLDEEYRFKALKAKKWLYFHYGWVALPAIFAIPYFY